jgi:hypothetical protein
MRNLRRTVTLSAAALVAAVMMAPRSDAQERNRGRADAPARGSERNGGARVDRNQGGRIDRNQGGRFDRHEGGRVDRDGSRFQGREASRLHDGGRFDRDRGRFAYGPGFRGFSRYQPHRSYVASRAYGYSPFRVFGGLRFYSSCPGPGYVYISDGDCEGWVYPPYAGAEWLPGSYDRFGVWIGGRWGG